MDDKYKPPSWGETIVRYFRDLGYEIWPVIFWVLSFILLFL